MKKIKALILAVVLSVSTVAPVKQARADLFGGDVAVLMQILAQAIQQLAQLKKILDTGKETVGLIEEINAGINDVLNLVDTFGPITDPGLYKQWLKVRHAISEIERIYGIVVDSRDKTVQKHTDQTVAEAISLNNQIYKYTKEIDKIGENIKRRSGNASPKGAAKLTAQSMGVMVHIHNQSLRAQATALKLQAQTLALQNRKDKDATRQMKDSSEKLQLAMDAQKPRFQLPQF